MIDIHTHILPSLDDGSRDMEESLRLAEMAVREGITTIIATPHHANGQYYNEADVVNNQVTSFQEQLQKNNIELSVLTGQEIRVYTDLLEDYEAGKLLTLANSHYLLLEFPSNRLPQDLEDLLYELQLLNITPVIAHPERNQELVNNPDRLWELVQSGARAQVTAHSINGLFGKKVQKAAFDICERNLAHVIASDVHNTGPRDYGLQQAFDLIGNRLGPDYAEYYKKNSKQILDSVPLSIWEPEKSKKKWYRFW